MNKALEVIEAHWLFDIPYAQIDVVVHPESIVHSMVEYVDGAVKMQASLPSMHLPIMHALSYPSRLPGLERELIRPLRWNEASCWHFEALELERFPCFRLAVQAGKQGGTYPSVLVGADEEAVELFLTGQIRFIAIPALIEATLERHQSITQPDVAATLEACNWARQTVRELAKTYV